MTATQKTQTATAAAPVKADSKAATILVDLARTLTTERVAAIADTHATDGHARYLALAPLFATGASIRAIVAGLQARPEITPAHEISPATVGRARIVWELMGRDTMPHMTDAQAVPVARRLYTLAAKGKPDAVRLADDLAQCRTGAAAAKVARADADKAHTDARRDAAADLAALLEGATSPRAGKPNKSTGAEKTPASADADKADAATDTPAPKVDPAALTVHSLIAELTRRVSSRAFTMTDELDAAFADLATAWEVASADATVTA